MAADFSMPFTCSLYGLGVQVDAPFAGLDRLPAATQIDVVLRLGEPPPCVSDIPAQEWSNFFVHREIDEQGTPILYASDARDCPYIRITYADATCLFLDKRGSEVWATWPASATLDDTATYLLGPGLGYLLRLRGTTCLHASAVAIDGAAIALVGPSGHGKSTTAAAFAQRGYPVLSDDVVALVESGSELLVQPAYPRIRLWPESVDGLFGEADALPRITESWDKRYLDLDAPGYRFQRTPLPLAAIYFLGERCQGPDAPRIESIGSRPALMLLIADTYGTHIIEQKHRAEEFATLGKLVESLPLRRVRASSDIARLDDLCMAIADDFRRSRPRASID